MPPSQALQIDFPYPQCKAWLAAHTPMPQVGFQSGNPGDKTLAASPVKERVAGNWTFRAALRSVSLLHATLRPDVCAACPDDQREASKRAWVSH